MSDINSKNLGAYLSAQQPDRIGLVVRDLITLNTGWESDVYAFSAEWGPPHRRQEEDLILRVYPGDDASEKSEREFKALRFLFDSGYPVPRTDLLESDPGIFGKPFLIMERVRGQDMWGKMFHSDHATQQRLLVLFTGLFARLHRLPCPDEFLTDPSQNAVESQLARWERYIAAMPKSGFQANWDWLRAHLHDIRPTSVVPVHWDFHPNNLLLKVDGTAVVIDWTGFECTDYRFDLAWTLLLIGSNEGLQWRAAVLNEYERQAGHSVESLEFFDVAAAVRRLFSVIVSVAYGAEKLGMRPGAEEIMRRQAPALRRVYALLLARTNLPVAEVEQFLHECGA